MIDDQSTRDTAIRAESMIEAHVEECSRRYGELREVQASVFALIRQTNESIEATGRSVLKLENKVLWTLIFGVGSLISFSIGKLIDVYVTHITLVH